MFHTVKARIVAVFLVILVIVVTASIAFGYRAIREQEDEAIGTMGLSAAGSCAIVYEAFADGGDGLVPGTQEYDDCHETLRFICASYGMTYLYVCSYDVKAQTTTYLMCAAADDAADEMFNRERPYGTVVSGSLTDAELSALAGQPSSKPQAFDNEFGSMLDWYSPVEGYGGTILGAASYSLSQQHKRIMESMIRIVIPFVVALIALLVVELLVLRRHVFEPLRVIAGRMRDFSAERAGEVEPLGFDTRDELSDIADAFEGMASNIAEYTRDIERMTSERVQADVELDVARRIQLGMVPERAEASGAGFDLAAFARPAREVGGDFYDIAELGDGRVALVVGDVSGKGVAAALFMAMAKAMVRDALLAGADPVRALGQVNAQLCASNPEGMFATAFAAVIEPATGAVRFANAGHVPPLVVSDVARPLDIGPGTLLGLFDDAEIAAGEFTLEAGESLLVCTDGADEAVNAAGAFLGKGGLTLRLDAQAPFERARTLVDAVVATVDGFAEGREQFDDLTVVALHRLDVLPARMDSFGIVRGEILGKSADGSAGRRACLACEEAFANIVGYSQASSVRYAVYVDDGALNVTLEDDGAPFDPLAGTVEDKPFDELDAGGMGIALIRDIASGAAYRREAGWNILALRFDRR